ncbi:MAG: hypothetical protein R3F49_10465 [Planctomycetota bacterium]
MQTRLSLIVLLGALSVACTSPNGPPRDAKSQPDTATQAEAIQAAKDTARQAMVADLYERWRYEYVLYRKAVSDAVARSSAPPAGTGEAPGSAPVRSLDELLRASAPEEHNPEALRLNQAWIETSRVYDARLRELASDPDEDPRSPLRPDVREALAPSTPSQ